jgi:hypothetical protein
MPLVLLVGTWWERASATLYALVHGCARLCLCWFAGCFGVLGVLVGPAISWLGFHGKEGVTGSSPVEGLRRFLQGFRGQLAGSLGGVRVGRGNEVGTRRFTRVGDHVGGVAAVDRVEVPENARVHAQACFWAVA